MTVARSATADNTSSVRKLPPLERSFGVSAALRLKRNAACNGKRDNDRVIRIGFAHVHAPQPADFRWRQLHCADAFNQQLAGFALGADKSKQGRLELSISLFDRSSATRNW